MSWEQRNADFCNAQTDAQMAYIEAEREVDRLQTENAKLREELEKWNRLTENIELPEYPVTEFHPKDLERENAKLRELVRKYVEYTSQDRCEGCVCKRKCNDGDVDECWQRTEIRELARELGIEVDE